MLKSLTITLFLLALFIPTLFAQTKEPYPYAQEHDIINLGEPTWDHAIEDFPQGLIVYFYEDYCLPCREFWAKLIEATKLLKKPKDGAKPSQVQIAKVECHDEVKLCEAKGVSSYPTIMLYRRSKEPYEYRGDREVDAFEKWVRKVIDGDYEEVKNREELFKRYSLALLIAEGSEAAKVAYQDFIDDIEIANEAGELNYEIGNQAALVSPEGVPVKLTDSVDDIKSKIIENLRSVVPTFGARHSKQLQDKEDRKYLLYFRTNKFKYNSNDVNEFNKFSSDNPKDIEYAYVNVAGDILGKTMAKLLGVKEDDEPTVAYVVKVGKVLRKYKLISSISKDSLNNLIDSANKNPEENRYYMSANSTKPFKKGEILELTGKNFEEVTSNATNNVFVMFYFPWCEWCIKLEPTWKALAYRFRDVDNVQIARIDMSQNDAKGYELSEYPVLVYFDAKEDAKGEEYLSERSMNKLKKFLEDKIPHLKTIEL